jgi:hypothetical protein
MRKHSSEVQISRAPRIERSNDDGSFSAVGAPARNREDSPPGYDENQDYGRARK